MECSKWQETELLQASGELTPEETAGLKEHMAVCQYCAEEQKRYAEERRRYFSAEILGETSPQYIDETILNFSSRSETSARSTAVTPTSLGIFSLIFKKQSVGVLVLLLGVIVGFGIMVNYQKQSTGALQATFKASPTPAQVHPAAATMVAQQQSPSQKDSADKADKIPFSKRVGDISQGGVVPVDLHKP